MFFDRTLFLFCTSLQTYSLSSISKSASYSIIMASSITHYFILDDSLTATANNNNTQINLSFDQISIKENHVDFSNKIHKHIL